ncbi:MAG TPA: hypothetical protein VJV79_04080 [Polyangiaceae bacterium]|nr:hypothetical protein [Polyangiaceae bacterium]
MEFKEARSKAKALFDGVGRAATRCPVVELGRRESTGRDLFDHIIGMTPKGFPIEGLLLFGLTQFLGLLDDGREEKIAWSVWFSFKGATYAFEMRKFGLRLLCQPENLDKPLTREVLGKARALTDIVEAFLSDGFAQKQLEAGSFTVQNLYGTLEERYRFLRDQAKLAYERPPPPPETGTHEFGTWYRHDSERPDREGGTLGAAAVDAYFSRMEHLLCLAAGFANVPLPEGDFLAFLAEGWRAKARAMLDLGRPETKSFYDKLLAVREEWRNPLAHGGFLSNGGSLYFHLPGIGALPAQLRRTPTGVKLKFTMQHSSFKEVMELFDGFDEHMKAGPLRHAVQWAEAGMDVAFDEHSRRSYACASKSEEAFEHFLEGTQRAEDQAANMDW